MPKNGSRGVNSKLLASNSEDIDSNVVFGDSKAKKKAEQGSAGEGSAKKGGNFVSASGDDALKKPDTRELVGSIY